MKKLLAVFIVACLLCAMLFLPYISGRILLSYTVGPGVERPAGFFWLAGVGLFIIVFFVGLFLRPFVSAVYKKIK